MGFKEIGSIMLGNQMPPAFLRLAKLGLSSEFVRKAEWRWANTPDLESPLDIRAAKPKERPDIGPFRLMTRTPCSSPATNRED